ncbi:MAG: RdgB/HAM1 family non-canonical purine NTP pyrophosphatase [Nitrososphaerota archaeon]|nr:RdgB/HAM1 family non-canonical purine NTP pyrophosphatase [Nitrososphaerota archaeon]MDG7047707.1 RdgB/HAM1 family non-canonical purine NTP pyrophosphatase [Nitrososphaerota archaeon]MDG7048679.1 RdgB/HAM1 family non-canonical purine NTP pyrophosphatase [Nitrososphaerota archaeon]MDG7050911.1 RdgB/HAM1 family non-canonical purine NTP pyrophosphatase [Nitrososphaerota archaeon]
MIQHNNVPDELLFLTSNEGKYNEASFIMNVFGIKLVWRKTEKKEVQSDDVETVALEAAKAAAIYESSPFIIEDDGLFIDCLNGFPGPYSSYVLIKLGLERVLKLIDEDDRRARFKSAVALHLDGRFMIFTGIAEGTISFAKKGDLGFGYDPIFIPDVGKRTMAEMTVMEKSTISHRGKSLTSLAGYLKKFH